MLRILTLLFCLQATMLMAQPESIRQMIETARTFQRQGDLDNAILVLVKATGMEPDNLEAIRELSFTYYMQGQNDKAWTEIRKLVDRDDADEQVYQIAGNILVSKQDLKEADKLFKKALKRFPKSGALYNEYGQVLYAKEPGSDAAIKSWEKGIELDPNYSGNYYNACRYYGTTSNNLWCLIYGEMFVNLESYTNRTIEVKNILMDVYKQWYVSGNAGAKTSFEQQVTECLNKHGKEANFGITPDALSLIRTMFIIDWFNAASPRPAFKLFEYQRQLLQEGMFDAYNQWLFGSAYNTAAYQNWTNTHAEENKTFIQFQRGRVFKVPADQYYAKP